MTLNDARKLAIRRQLRIRFALSNGMEGVVNERGIAKVPQLATPGELNLEQEFARAAHFTLEPTLPGSDGKKQPAPPSTATREEMERMIGAAAGGAPVAPEHEE